MAGALPTVYLETSIFSYLTARVPKDRIVAGKIEVTHKWWTDARSRFDLVTSEFVTEEAADGDPEAAAARLKLIADVKIAPVDERVADLAAALISGHALPAKARVDATHIAVAAVNGIAYLLTWNCRHLANARLRSKIVQACKELGYSAPTICTPIDLLEEVEP